MVVVPEYEVVVPECLRDAVDNYPLNESTRGAMSLRQYIDSSGDRLGLMETIAVLKDVCNALADLEASVVHRELKPQNILRLPSHWCLADFGIARDAEATTAPDTQKFALVASVHRCP